MFLVVGSCLNLWTLEVILCCIDECLCSDKRNHWKMIIGCHWSIESLTKQWLHCLYHLEIKSIERTSMFFNFWKSDDPYSSHPLYCFTQSMRTRIRLSFAHHMTPVLLRTLGFEWQVINLLLRKAISFFTVWSNHQWSVIR